MSLGIAIALFCSFQTGSSQYEKNMDCSDFMVNCTITTDDSSGYNFKLEQCKQQYKKGARYESK